MIAMHVTNDEVAMTEHEMELREALSKGDWETASQRIEQISEDQNHITRFTLELISHYMLDQHRTKTHFAELRTLSKRNGKFFRRINTAIDALERLDATPHGDKQKTWDNIIEDHEVDRRSIDNYIKELRDCERSVRGRLASGHSDDNDVGVDGASG
jgi:hypothetical protein